jgi:uncharacterized protein YggU (UPF0235/DUF167 family)
MWNSEIIFFRSTLKIAHSEVKKNSGKNCELKKSRIPKR